MDMASVRAKLRIKSGDEVIVIAGKKKGTVGRVLRVIPAARKVVVEGVARVKRHQKPVGDQPGGIIEKEMPIDVSNVALWDAEANERVKVGYTILDDGRKVRVNRRTGAQIDE
jgi:large subunit ribosomal protein L24